MSLAVVVLGAAVRSNKAMTHRVGAPVARGASHRTGFVLFTSGSSGHRVLTPSAGRDTTSRYPSASRSCTGAMRCWNRSFHICSSDTRPFLAKYALSRPR